MREVSAIEIATLIRQQNWKNGGVLIIDLDEAVGLIEQYAQVVASGAAAKATQEAFDSAIATITSKSQVPA